MTTASGPEKQKPLQVLDRALTVLDCIASTDVPMTLHDLATKTGIHPSTVHRLLWSLAGRNLVARDENNTWHLGMIFLEYSQRVRDRMPIREHALPVMQQLYEHTGQTINLCVRNQDSIMYIDHVYAPQMGVKLAQQIGALAPMYCTSSGKLFLRDCTPEEVSAYISRTDLVKLTPYSIDSAEKLILELDRVKEFDWAEDRQELEIGVECFGSAVRDASGKVVAAITVVSTPEKMVNKPLWLPLLKKATDQISYLMGYRG